MDRFLVQVPHDPEPLACAKVVDVFLRTGSHYLAGADWGCSDGDSKEEARQVVPAALRAETRVVKLNKFTLDQIQGIMRQHQT
jgi:hypothetical protein